MCSHEKKLKIPKG